MIRFILALLDAMANPPCPFGGGPSAECFGCGLDRQWVGSTEEDHVP